MGFFDELGKKVSQTTNNIQESTNRMQKESRCKKTIAENKAKLERVYNEIGKKVCDKRVIDDELQTYIEGKIKDIDGILKQNEDLEQEILRLNNKRQCPGCGAIMENQNKFCPECGLKIEIPNEVVEVPESNVETIIADLEKPVEEVRSVEVEQIEVVEEPKTESTVVATVGNETTKVEEIHETAKAEESKIIETKTEETKIEWIPVQNTVSESPILEGTIIEEKKEELVSSDDSRFAPHTQRKCSGCGEFLEDEDIFCPNCGRKG